MKKVKEFNLIVKNHAEQPVDFIILYTEEAHAVDGWSIKGNKVKVNNHRTLQERLEAAKLFVELGDVDCPVFVDSMDNEANKMYGALPDRLYIIQRGIVAYEGGKGPIFYNLKQMTKELKKLIAQ